MKIFDGKKAADDILNGLKKQIKTAKIRPSFAVILVGGDEASKLYIRLKKKAALKVGISVREYFFDSRASEEKIIKKITELNKDSGINGIIIQLPLPLGFDTEKIIEAVDSKKDIDGFHRENQKLLKTGKTLFLPPLPSAILLSAEAVGAKPNKKILALVRSKIFGEGLKAVFKKNGFLLDYIVKTDCIFSGIIKKIRSADVLISVLGCPNSIKSDIIKKKAILIDGGITRLAGGKIAGDIDKESVKTKALFLTPVPGGIGPLTVALLLKNVYLAAKRLRV